MLIKGYAACEEHVEVIRQPTFNFVKLLQFGKKNQNL
jgi:hypothetical protein